MKIKKPPVGVRVLLGILSVILCVALFCTTVLTMVVADLKVLTGKDTLQTVISQLIFANNAKSAPVHMVQAVGVGGIRLEEADVSQGDATQFVVDFLYDYLSEAFGEDLEISKEDVSALLEESTIPEFVSDKMSSMVSDIITGESTTEITGEEILQLVEENKTIIEDVIGQELPEEVIEKIVTTVEETNVVDTVKEAVEVQLGLKPAPGGDDQEGAVLSPVIKENVVQGVLSGETSLDDIMNGDILTILALVRELTVLAVILKLLGVCLVLIVLLFVANYWKPHAALRGVGITLMVASLPFVAATVAVYAVPALFTAKEMQLVAMLIQLVVGVTFTVFSAGIAMLVGSIVWGSAYKKKLLAAEAVPAVEATEA